MEAQQIPEELLLIPELGGELVGDPGEVPRPLAAGAAAKPYPATICIILMNIAFRFLSKAITSGDLPFGTNSGMLTLTGDWWRLFTSMFLQVGLEHLFANLIFLWLFGRRLERAVGWKLVVFVYLSCGVAGGFVSLTVHPERGSYGASGAVIGLAGALISLDASRLQRLFWRGWLSFAVAVAVALETILAGRNDVHTDNAAHIGGLLMGLALGALLALGWFQRSPRRIWEFAGVAIVLACCFLLIRLDAGYIVPLGRASRAMDSGQTEEAARQLKLAIVMRPDNASAKTLARELVRKDWKVSGLPEHMCSLFSFDPAGSKEKSLKTLQSSPCDGKICDGRLHVTQLQTGARLSDRGTVETSAPMTVDGALQSIVTTTVISQTLDVFGEIGCTVKDVEIAKRYFDSRGMVVQNLKVSRSTETIGEFDPIAIAIREDTLRGNP